MNLRFMFFTCPLHQYMYNTPCRTLITKEMEDFFSKAKKSSSK